MLLSISRFMHFFALFIFKWWIIGILYSFCINPCLFKVMKASGGTHLVVTLFLCINSLFYEILYYNVVFYICYGIEVQSSWFYDKIIYSRYSDYIVNLFICAIFSVVVLFVFGNSAAYFLHFLMNISYESLLIFPLLKYLFCTSSAVYSMTGLTSII